VVARNLAAEKPQTLLEQAQSQEKPVFSFWSIATRRRVLTR
jgi:hypothetical protein